MKILNLNGLAFKIFLIRLNLLPLEMNVIIDEINTTHIVLYIIPIVDKEVATIFFKKGLINIHV